MKNLKPYSRKEKLYSTILKSTKRNGRQKKTKPSKPLALKTSTSNSTTSRRPSMKCKKSKRRNKFATNKSDCSKSRPRPSSKMSKKNTNDKLCFFTRRTLGSESIKRKRPASVMRSSAILRPNADRTSTTLKKS
jgi:hypothetical protein